MNGADDDWEPVVDQIRFTQFWNRINEGAKHEKFEDPSMFEAWRNIKESIHVLTTKFDILRKPECPVY
jgi:hypothetical protein